MYLFDDSWWDTLDYDNLLQNTAIRSEDLNITEMLDVLTPRNYEQNTDKGKFHFDLPCKNKTVQTCTKDNVQVEQNSNGIKTCKTYNVGDQIQQTQLSPTACTGSTGPAKRQLFLVLNVIILIKH